MMVTATYRNNDSSVLNGIMWGEQNGKLKPWYISSNPEKNLGQAFTCDSFSVRNSGLGEGGKGSSVQLQMSHINIFLRQSIEKFQLSITTCSFRKRNLQTLTPSNVVMQACSRCPLFNIQKVSNEL